MSSRRFAAQVYTNKLVLNTEQRQEIDQIYQRKDVDDFTYFEGQEQQVTAAALMATHHLDFDARESLASRWSIKWSAESGKGNKKSRRVLLQWCVSLKFIN